MKKIKDTFDYHPVISPLPSGILGPSGLAVSLLMYPEGRL